MRPRQPRCGQEIIAGAGGGRGWGQSDTERIMKAKGTTAKISEGRRRPERRRRSGEKRTCKRKKHLIKAWEHHARRHTTKSKMHPCCDMKRRLSESVGASRKQQQQRRTWNHGCKRSSRPSYPRGRRRGARLTPELRRACLQRHFSSSCSRRERRLRTGCLHPERLAPTEEGFRNFGPPARYQNTTLHTRAVRS